VWLVAGILGLLCMGLHRDAGFELEVVEHTLPIKLGFRPHKQPAMSLAQSCWEG
jgi:hypothetical protein